MSEIENVRIAHQNGNVNPHFSSVVGNISLSTQLWHAISRPNR